MEDATTIVELSIEPTELFQIVQNWATETKFSIHEKSEKRTIYIKNIRLNTAWLLIENQGENTILKAWLGSKSLNPDTKGSFWKGYKLPIPNGFAIGPVSIYKKEFSKLMTILGSKSKNIPEIVIRNENSVSLQVIKAENYSKAFNILGVISLIGGAINIMSAINPSSTLFPELANVSMKNGIFEITTGIIMFICSKLLKQGKASAIWIYGAITLLSIAYNNLMGHKFPYFTIIFGAFIMWQLLGLKKQGELV